VVKRKMSNFGVKRAKDRAWPQPTLPSAQAVVIVGASKPAPIRRPRGTTPRQRGPTRNDATTCIEPADHT
jgi:hypothetical protein